MTRNTKRLYFLNPAHAKDILSLRHDGAARTFKFPRACQHHKTLQLAQTIRINDPLHPGNADNLQALYPLRFIETTRKNKERKSSLKSPTTRLTSNRKRMMYILVPKSPNARSL